MVAVDYPRVRKSSLIIELILVNQMHRDAGLTKELDGFRIGEVSTITGVPPYVLRYWESEFPALQPRKSGGGQRLYRKRDVAMILEIKKLLYQERYTVAGARRRLTEREERARRMEARAALQRLRAGLEGILKQLS